MTTKFEYLLNAMENAAAQDNPSAHGYAGKRQMVLKYVADSDVECQRLREALDEYWKKGCQCGDSIEICDLCKRTQGALGASPELS